VRRLLGRERRLHAQEAEPLHVADRRFDAERVVDRRAQHLVAAADADDRRALASPFYDRTRHAADRERVPGHQHLLVAPRPDALLADGEKFSPG